MQHKRANKEESEPQRMKKINQSINQSIDKRHKLEKHYRVVNSH